LSNTSFFICSINDGQLKLEDGPPSKAMLENNKCFLLDCGAEVLVWVGRVTQVDDRKAASMAAEVKERTQELNLRF
jgi:Gelsolin repeat